MKRIYLPILLCFLSLAGYAQVNITATSGTLAGSYTTLGAAFAAINAGTHSGAITVGISANTNESGPCVLNSGDAAPASYTSVVIRPTADGVTIAGATTTGRGLIELNGADNVTIDGDNAGSAGTNRNLTVTNTAANTITFTSCIRIALSTLVTSSNNNTVRNCNLTGSGTGRNISTQTSEVTTWGLVASGNASTVAVTAAPSALTSAATAIASGQTVTNLIIDNNNIQTVSRGVSVNGGANTVAVGLEIKNNVIGNPTLGSVDQVWAMGITAQGSSNGLISGNTVRLEGFIGSSTPNKAIDLGTTVGTAVGTFIIERNIIERAVNNNGGTWPAVGINVQGTAANNINSVVRNNFIYNCVNSQVAGTGGFGTTFGAYGIRLATGTGHKVYHNTVSFTGAVPGSTNTNLTACLCIVSTAVTGCDVRNNIFSNQHTGGNPAASSNAYTCIFLPSGATSAMNLTINNNALYQGSTAISYIGQVGTTAGTNTFLSANFNASATTPANNFRSYTSTLSVAGTNDNATLAFGTGPLFVSATDLHLQAVGGNLPLISGAPGTGVTTDIDGTTRSGATPVIGAHEVSLANCTGTPTPGTVSASAASGCGTFNTNLSTVGTTTGVSGLEYQWQSSPDGVAPYLDITGATNTTFTATVTATTFYRARIRCSFSGFSDNTPGVQIISNAIPASITGVGSTCVGGTLNLASTTGGGTWTSAIPGVATVDLNTGLVTGVAAGTSNITYTVTATGCFTTATVTVNLSPSAPVVTPATAVVCHGTGTNVTASSTYPQVSTTSSGPISFSMIDNDLVGNSVTLNVGLPAGAVITGVSVNFNLNHTFDADVDINLVAPNGNSLSLLNDVGGSLDNFTNTTISSTGVTSISSGTAPFTGTFAPGGAIGVGSTLYPSNVSNFSGLYSVPNGTWRLALVDDAGGDLGTLTSWSLTINYTLPSSITWSPNAGLFEDAALSIPYTGAVMNTVYASPNASGSVQTVNNYTVTASGGGCSATAPLTVTTNPLPATIGGIPTVCVGLTRALTNADGGGTWNSANTAIATVNATTGVVTGVSAGVTNISYTFTGTGCTRTVTVTVNELPAAIMGTAQVCQASTTTLTNTTTGGTWSSGNTATAIVGMINGVVNGIAAGTSNITYTLPTSCISTRTVSVNPLPLLTVTPATPTTLCIGESTSAYTAAATMPGFSLLNQNFTAGLGGWTIENLIGLPSGQWQIVPSGFDGTLGDGSPMLQASPNVSGGQVHTRLVSPSFSTVGYTVATLKFNHYVISDAADAVVAVEYSTDGGTVWNTLQNYQNTFTGTGTWSASTPNATIVLPIGAINQADVKIRWNYNASFYGWFVDNIKVDADLPAATYTWSGGSDLSCTTCTNPTITPAATGANIYTVAATSSASCISEATATVNVNPLPAVITSSSFEVCEGLTTTLASADGGGTWTSGNTSVATVNSSTGVVTGQSFGTAAITYTLPTGCIRTAVVTVNALPAAITGTMQVCEGLTTTLSSAPTGGTWSSSNTNASVDGAGVVTGNTFGTATITYTLPSSCIRTAIVTVNALPAAISGTQEVCVGLTTTLTSAPTGGTWTSSSTGRASVGASSGIVTGVAAGNAMITYMLSTGCIRSAEVTVNALPAVITGTMQVCEGLTTTLSSAPTGGNWSSSNTNASVDGAGVVTGSTFGTATITYQLPVTGCIRTAVVTVNQLPSAITGMLEVCEGLTTTLASTPTGGSWSSSNANASVNVFGIVTGNTFGTATITYVRPVTGCIRTAEVTVNALPSAITGNVEVCEGAAIALGSTPSGGSWTSSNTNASVDASGMVTGNTFGTATITYQLPVTGCIRTAVVTVNQLPSAISGTLEVCEGLTTTLVSTPTGGTWSSSNANASVSSAGVVTGNTFGTATITYERPVTGCIRTAEVTVHALPVAIVGATQVCATSAITLTNADAGGSWSSSNPSVGSVDAVTGVVTGIMAGSVVITYTLPTSCIATHNVVVNALPVVYNVTGGGSYCDFASGVLVGVDNSDIGTTYSLYRGTIFMASQPGVGSSIDFGFMTAAGTYTVLATSSASCENAMSGSATVIITPSVMPVVSLTTTPNDTVCAGTSVTFTATSVNGGTAPAYTWTVNGSLVTSTVSTHSYVPLNGDVVVVTMTSNEVCPLPSSVSASQTMVVVSNQTPTVSIAVGPNDTLCQGSTAVYGALSTFGGSAPVYTWYKNNVSTGVTGSIYSYVPVNGDVVSARLNSNYRCPISNNVESNKITMRIDTIFVPVVAITTNTGLSISLNQSVTFTAAVSKGGTAPKYQWLKNSTAVAGATNVTYTTSALANNDSVTCVVYGTGDCSYFTFNSVKMKVTTGFEQVSGGEADIRMMPNPNSGDFVINGTLATTNDATVAIDVTNMLGQTVYSSTAVVKGGNLNESVKLNNTLANGMYILNVHSGTESKVFHFVLRK
jgi:trimeric autotransporter adhesin